MSAERTVYSILWADLALLTSVILSLATIRSTAGHFLGGFHSFLRSFPDLGAWLWVCPGCVQLLFGPFFTPPNIVSLWPLAIH